jgi:hypothetical protein
MIWNLLMRYVIVADREKATIAASRTSSGGRPDSVRTQRSGNMGVQEDEQAWFTRHKAEACHDCGKILWSFLVSV